MMTSTDMERNHEASHLDINALPDLAMLKIFSHLDFFDLCKCARVCCRWYHLTKAHRFRKRIIIRHVFRRRGDLFCLLKYHCTEPLEEFQLLPSDMLMFAQSELIFLFQRCSRLKKLVLMYCYLNYFSLSTLPVSVTHLSVRGSHVVPETFFASSHLVCLDLSGVRQFLTSAEMPLINKCTSLRALFLEGCDRINNAGIEAIQDILPGLEVIDVEATDISNQGAVTVLNFCSNAKDVYLGYTSIDDEVFDHVKPGALPFLRDFCVQGTEIHPAGLMMFLVKHINSVANNKRYKEFHQSCIDYEQYHKIRKVAFGSISGCHHYVHHPDYGQCS